MRFRRPYRWLFLGATSFVLLVASGCGACAKPHVASNSLDAGEDGQAIVDSQNGASQLPTRKALPTLDAERVTEVYSVLTAGDARRAASLLSAMKIRSEPLDPRKFARAGFFGADSDRVLVATDTACSFGDLGQEKCHAAIERVGGSCDGGKLTATCGQILLDSKDGAVKAFYRGAGARAEGNYLLTFEHEDKTVVRRPTTLEEVMVTEGEVVAAIGGNRLVSIRFAASPSGSPSARRTTLVRVVDPAHGTITPPCPVATPISRSTKFRLLSGGNRLLISEGTPYSKIAVCALDTGRLVQRIEAEGDNTVLVNHDEKQLFVSGIPVPSAKRDPLKPEFTALFDHLRLDLGTGSNQRLRTKESTADVPGRDMQLTGDEKTLIVASNRRVTLFETSPFRVLASVDLGPASVALDSSYNVTPSLHLLPDGKTLLALYVVTDYVPPRGEARQRFDVWVLSTEARKVIYRGTSLTGWREDAKVHRGAIIVDTSLPREERVLLVADEIGIKTRPLDAGEGDGTNEKLPPEFASLKEGAYSFSPPERTFDTTTTPPDPEPAMLQRLSGQLCAASGLIVPKAACPSN